MGNAAFNIVEKFVTIDCCNCGIIFAVPKSIKGRWQDAGNNFYCPNGHVQHFAQSTVSRLEEKIQHLEKVAQWAKVEQHNLRNCLRAEKGAKTRLKNRISKGVCPCCKRNFVNVARHMTTKHKDWISK